MVSEGYLQLKIKEVREENKKLKDEVFQLENRFNRLSKDAINALKEERIKYLKVNKKTIQDLFNEEYSKFFKEQLQERYNELHGFIYKEVKDLKRANNTWIKKFIEEVVLHRKDYSLILSILIQEKIIDNDKLRKYDKEMLKAFNSSDISKKVYDIFMPMITKKSKEVKR